MTTRIGKNEAKILEGVATNLFTDTRVIIEQASGVMDSIYQACKKVVKGREQAHVKYLLSCYKQLVNDDPSISAAKGTVDQITAAINRILKDGGELPDSYTQARRLAYPPKASQPRGPRAPSEGGESGEGEGGTTTTTGEPARESRTLSAKMGQLIGYLLEMEADGGEAFAYAEQAIRNAYAEWTIARSLASDAAESLDMADEA